MKEHTLKTEDKKKEKIKTKFYINNKYLVLKKTSFLFKNRKKIKSKFNLN
jgi:hypothetical protein